jgi:gustatory receptor
VSAILLCDSILKKDDEIVAQAYRLETQLSSKENEEIQVLIDVVLHNRPEFRAARFFSIDRATLFSVLNSLTTFLLVIIQFKEL